MNLKIGNISPDGFSQDSYRLKMGIQYHESISSQIKTVTVQ